MNAEGMLRAISQSLNLLGRSKTMDQSIDHSLAPKGVALLRIAMGVLFLAHGPYLKLVVFGLAGTVGFFESLGLPAAFAYLTILGETAIGIALILGFQARWAALAAVPIMLGALWVHSGNGWVFSGEGGGWEYPAFWTAALFAQFLMGDGAYALKPSIGVSRLAEKTA
jgi:putative oxidoreductase